MVRVYRHSCTSSEPQPGRCSNEDEAGPECRCRASLFRANLNGANLVGANFDDTDMREASLLGVTIGASQLPSRVQPADCVPTISLGCTEFVRLHPGSPLGAKKPEDIEQQQAILDELSQICLTLTWDSKLPADVSKLLPFLPMDIGGPPPGSFVPPMPPAGAKNGL